MPVYLDAILFPSGDGAGTFEAIGGPTAKWQTVNSGIEAPFDSTYLRASGVEVKQAGGKTQFLNLEELPPYFNTMDTISGIVRLQVAHDDDYELTLQFFEGDSTTPLTSASGKFGYCNTSTCSEFPGTPVSQGGTFANYVFNFDLKNRNHGFCAWEDALLKITVESDEDSSPVDISEIQVNAIYTSGAGRCADGRPIRHCDCDPPVATDGTCCWCDKTTNPASFSYYCVENITPADCFSQYPNSSWAKVAGGCSSRDCSSICGENKWTCVDPEITTIDRCIEASNGQYLSQQECLDACKTTGWNCVGNACVEVDKSVSTYATQAECESACWLWECSGVPDPNDIPGGRECQCVQSPNGTYDTQDVCRSGEWWWGCSWDEVAEDSICIQTSSGIYLNAPICSGAIAAEGCPPTDCCQWDGVASIVLSGVTCDDNNVYQTFTVPEGPPGSWNWESQLACGDNFSIGISCDSAAAVGPDKWQIDSFSATCMDIELEGELTPPTCDVAPSWLFKINSSDGCAECCPSGDWICQDNECVDVGPDYTGGETVYISEQECQENCSVPSGACCYQTGSDGWECMNYKTEEECTAFATVTNWYEDEVCVDCTWLYECVTPCGDPDGCSEPSCVRTADGTYATKALCEAECVAPTGACCVDNVCTPNQTEAQCEALGVGATSVAWYENEDCVDCTWLYECVDGSCVRTENGTHATKELCQASCLGSCCYQDEDLNWFCQENKTETECSALAESPGISNWYYDEVCVDCTWLYECTDAGCVRTADGTYNTKAECEAACIGACCADGVCTPNQTEAQCEALGSVTNWYQGEDCVDCSWLYECTDAGCVRTEDGTYSTKAECVAACIGACCADGVCTPNQTEPECSERDGATTWYQGEDCVDCNWLYECTDVSGCVRTADGTYATKALCRAECTGACCYRSVKEILRPNGHTGNPWDSFNYTLINDDVEYPSAAGDSDIAVCDNSDDGDRGTWDMTAVTTLTSITNCRIHLRHKGGGYSNPVDVDLYIGGSWQTAVSLSVTSSFAWVYADFSGSWSSSDFDDALLGVTTGSIGGGGEYHLAVAYFELSEGDPADPGEEWTCVENQTEEQCSSFSGETKWYRDENCDPDCDWLYECVDQSATDPSNPTVCIRTADGTHATKALCEAVCDDPLPSGACCVNDGGAWTCYPDRTSQQCSDLGAAASYSNWYQDETCEPDCSWLYECVDGSCVRTADGTFDTKDLCVADCVAVGACCVDSVCTPNQTQEECSGLAVSAVSATWYVNETCDPDCDWLYECTEVSGCVRTPDGTYETKDLCDSYCIMGRCCWLTEDDDENTVENCDTTHESGCAVLRENEVIDPLVAVSGWVSGVNCTDDPCEWYDACCNWDGKVTISFAGPSGLYLDPNSDILRFGWSDGDSYTDVDDGVRMPQSHLNEGQVTSYNSGEYIQFGTEDVPEIPATSFAVSVLIHTDDTEGSGVDLMWAGAWQGFKLHSERERGPVFDRREWDQYRWDIVTDLSAGVSGIGMEILNGWNENESNCTQYCGEDETEVDAAYIEVEYVCNEDAPECPYCSHTEEIQMTGCREDFYPNAIIPHCWEYFGEVDCGDTVALKVYCDPDLPVSDSGKWTLTQFDRSCADPVTPSATGVLSNPEECDKSPSFYGKWAETKDCECCREHCCDWDGSAAVTFLNGETPCFDVSYTLTKRSDYIWEFGSSGIGDASPVYGDLGGNDYYLRLSCDPDKSLSDSDEIKEKWTILDIDLPCAENFRVVGGSSPWLSPPSCDNPPNFHLAFDSMAGCTGSTCPDS